jgi:hypothetical protein
MSQERDRPGQVLHWDDVYAQYANAAEAMPIAAIDRELAAKGYDRSKVRAAIGRLAGHGDAPAAARSSAPFDGRRPPALPPLTPPAILHDGTGPERSAARGWRARHAVAGLLATAALGLLVLPISEALMARWAGTRVATTDGQPRGTIGSRLAVASTVRARTNNASTADKAELYRAKVAMLKKCGPGVPKERCGTDTPTSTNQKESFIHDVASNGLAATCESKRQPQLSAHSSAHPSSNGTG